jgi:predicted  nucleic acid-binding Zn-ribbon protein
MLTKNDLNQIKKVVKEEIKTEVSPLSKKIDALDKKLSSKIDAVDKKLDKVQEDIGEYLNSLEPRVTIVEKGVNDIEENLNFPKSQ